jgi:hypothetical protein
VDGEPRGDAYFSVDIEADGPIPGVYSMLSLGVCLAGYFDGEVFRATDPSAHSFYVELKPISERFEPAALEVARLDRAVLSREGSDPTVAIAELCSFLEAGAAGSRPIVCAYPAGFDWTFLYWYLVRFGPEQPPLGFNSVLDVKTMYAVRAHVPFDRAGIEDLPDELRGRHPHTHNALDDAIQQAEVFSNLFDWHA